MTQDLTPSSVSLGSVAAPARVLIADDDQTMCAFCSLALTQSGYEVVVSSEAEAALIALREHGPFELLLADIQMPGLSGLELAQTAREHDPAIAVVIMTGHTSLDTLHGAVRRGVADYLSKPFELEELRDAVDQALQKRRLLQESLRLRALEQLLSSSEAINATLDRGQLAQVILARARAHVPSLAGFLLLDGAAGLPSQVIAAPTGATLLAAGRTVAAQALSEGRATAIAADEPLCAVDEQRPTRGLAVPLRAQNEVVGVMLLSDDRADLVSVGAQEILSLLAIQASNALRNAQLFGELDSAYRSLRELDRLKSEFIAIASHELRSPLSIVMGYARMVRDRSEGDQRDYAGRVLEGAERIKGIVDDMMRLHDFDRKQSALTIEPWPLDELVRQVIEQLVASAQQKGQQLLSALPEAPLTLRMDREKARLVISNLLSNAIKFTRADGTIQVVLERWPHERLLAAVSGAAPNPTLRQLTAATPQAWAVVRVQDNGIGIARDQQARIFDRFYQVASSLTREQGGVGLGLAIVGDLATLQRGVIWVESEQNQGSVFSFALPYEL